LNFRWIAGNSCKKPKLSTKPLPDIIPALAASLPINGIRFSKSQTKSVVAFLRESETNKNNNCMKKSVFISFFCAALAYVVLSSHSTGLSTDNTGAQGSPGCSCHSPTANSLINVTIELDSAGAPISHYVGGGSYTVKITGTNNTVFSLPYFGFQLTTVKSSGAGTGTAVYSGTLASTGLPSGCQNTAVGTLHLVQHSTPNLATTGTGATGTTYVRSIAWTAPASGTGSIALYGVINAVNHDGTSAGDYWNAATAVTIPEFVPLAGITGDSTVCVGSTITLADASTGGTYTSGSPTIASVGSASGIVSGLTGGICTITYTLGSSTAWRSITVNAAPATPAPVSGSSAVCVGSTITLSDATSGGTWSAANGHATVVGGVVTGVSSGIDSINYTVSNSCGSSTAMKVVTINTLPFAGTITGSPTLCFGSTTTFADVVSGGTWSSSDTAVATVFPGGIVLGVGTGSATLSYSVSGTCGVSTAYSAPLTVSNPPSVGTITGPNSVCLGGTATLADTVTGGVWSATNGNISISTAGVATGNAVGQDSILFSVTGGCGTAFSYFVMGVDTTPHAEPIAGPSVLCVGASVTISDTVYTGFYSGGISPAFSDSNIHLSPIGGSNSALLTGLHAGVDTLTLVITDACGTAGVSKAFTINPAPYAGTITGLSAVCLGGVETLTDSIAGGVWSSTDTFTTAGGSGIVGGHALGSDTIVYSLTNSCGTASAIFPVAVSAGASAGTISGAPALCTGTSATLAETVMGGVWTCANSNASITSGGVVTALNAGADTVNYTVTESCGSGSASFPLTIYANPGPILGPDTLCTFTTAAYFDSLSGGTWSTSDTAVATVTAEGVATAVVSGNVLFSLRYTSSAGCTVTTDVVATNVIQPSVISGTDSVCPGSTITLTDSVLGGMWSASNGHASVTGAGIVTGNTAGIDTISYSVYNACGVGTSMFTINTDTLPTEIPIIGAGSLCVGATVTISDSLSGTGMGVVPGVSNGNMTLDTISGMAYVLATGVSEGLDTLTLAATNACGSASTTKVFTVNGLPLAGSISGTDSLCPGSEVVWSATIGGGSWSATNTDVVVAAGHVIGVVAGVDTISYSISNSCGTAAATEAVTVLPLPTACLIPGADSVCTGAAITVVPCGTGGTWTVHNGHASISGGIVTGITAGIDTVVYTVLNACGSDSALVEVTIRPFPHAEGFTLPDSICVGATFTVADSVGGGTFRLSNGNAALTDSLLAGIHAGKDTLYYTLTNGCGSDSVKQAITIKPLPVGGIVSGDHMLCVGTTSTLMDAGASGSGTWSCTNGRATISAAGVVAALAAGADTVEYAVANACATVAAAYIVTLNGIPNPGAVTGASEICLGTITTYSDTVVGGAWRVTNHTSSINSSGVVSGMAYGADTVVYTVTSPAGCSDSALLPITVDTLASPTISGRSYVCVGGSDTLVVTPAGGTWILSNGDATVSGSVLTGVAPGIDSVQYLFTNACGVQTALVEIAVLTPSGCDSVLSVPSGTEAVSSISCYPNPNTGHFTVAVPLGFNGTVLVADVYGNAVWRGAVTGHSLELDLGRQAAGTYFVTVANGVTVYHAKVVVY
jgi:hypothetical protein